MLTGFHAGGLELRRQADGTTRLHGRFPYGKAAVLTDGGRTGRPRKERFAPRAFSYRVEDPKEDILLLAGHSYDRPLASRATGTLKLSDTAAALLFDATITREVAETSYGRDALALLASGLAVGLSPGFRIPPARAVADAEEITEEPADGSPDADGQPQHGAIIRTIKAALLYELSIVTRPAYAEAEVEARCWQVPANGPSGLQRTLMRWRR